MTTQPEVIRHSDFLNQLVFDRNTMEELGRVEVIWMYTPAHKVLGFVCKAGFLGAKKLAFNLSQLHTFGAKSILVSSAPQETDVERVNQLESLINCEVWTDAGNKIGKITDYLFNLKTGEISEYLLTSSGWAALTDGVYRLTPSKILSLGRRRVLVSEATVRSLSTYREGLRQKLRKAEELLKEDYSQVTQELRSLTHRAQSATEQAKERARLLAEQAKERAQSLNEQLKEGTQTLAQQAKEKSQILAEQMKEQVEQVKEQAQVIREQLSEEDLPRWDEPESEVPDSIFDEDWDIETPPSPSNPQPEVASQNSSAKVTAPPSTESIDPSNVENLDITSPQVTETVDDRTPETSEAPVKPTEVVDEWDTDLDDLWDIETPAPPSLAGRPSIASETTPTETITVNATEVDAPSAPPKSTLSTAGEDDDDEPWI